MYECIFPGKSCFLCIFWLPTLSCVCEVLCGIVLRKKKNHTILPIKLSLPLDPNISRIKMCCQIWKLMCKCSKCWYGFANIRILPPVQWILSTTFNVLYFHITSVTFLISYGVLVDCNTSNFCSYQFSLLKLNINSSEFCW